MIHHPKLENNFRRPVVHDRKVSLPNSQRPQCPPPRSRHSCWRRRQCDDCRVPAAHPLVRPRRRGNGTRKGRFHRDSRRTHRPVAPIPWWVPRRLRLVTWRKESGCPNKGSKINGLDLASTAFSSPSVNSVPTRRPSRPSRANLDCQPNHWLKNVRIVFSYFAENALKHRSRSSRQVDTRSSRRTSH
jgi:hypothetical protein